MSRVLVTGATGFVGRHLVRLLQERGDRVFGTCYPDHPASEDRDFAHLDLRSEADLAEFVRSGRPEGIFHLAALSNVRQSWEKRAETIETNLLGTSNLLEAVRRFAPGCRLLFLSSSDVYGELSGEEKYFKEEDPCRVVNPYAFTKAAGELLCHFYVDVEKLDIVIARPFPHTGPGQTANFVFSDWAWQVALIERGGKPPFIEVGNLAIRRDYSDVRDTVKAYVLLMDKGRPRGDLQCLLGPGRFLAGGAGHSSEAGRPAGRGPAGPGSATQDRHPLPGRRRLQASSRDWLGAYYPFLPDSA